MGRPERVRFACDSDSRPLTLVTFNPDGTEHHWRYDRTVAMQPDTEPDGEAPSARWGQCEWLCHSQYRTDRCGRSGYHDGWGMTLCWQHQDSLFRDVLHRTLENLWPPLQLQHLAEALAGAPWHPGPYSGPSPVQRMLEAEIIGNLHDLLDDTAVISAEVQSLVDKLIDQRLAQRMGADDAEAD